LPKNNAESELRDTLRNMYYTDISAFTRCINRNQHLVLLTEAKAIVFHYRINNLIYIVWNNNQYNVQKSENVFSSDVVEKRGKRRNIENVGDGKNIRGNRRGRGRGTYRTVETHKNKKENRYDDENDSNEVDNVSVSIKNKDNIKNVKTEKYLYDELSERIAKLEDNKKNQKEMEKLEPDLDTKLSNPPGPWGESE